MKRLKIIVALVALLVASTLASNYLASAAIGPTSACTGVDQYVATYLDAQNTVSSQTHSEVWDKELSQMTPEDFAILSADALLIAQTLSSIDPPPALLESHTIDASFWFMVSALFDTASRSGLDVASALYDPAGTALSELSDKANAEAISRCPAAETIYSSSDPQA